MAKNKPKREEAETQEDEVIAKEPEIMTEAESKVFDMKMEADSLVSDFRDFVIGYLKGLPVLSYDGLKEDEQRDLSGKLEYRLREIMHQALSIVAGKGCETIVAKVDSITVKGGLKVVLKIDDTGDNYDILGDMRTRKEVMLVATSMADFDKIQREAAISPDQGDLLEGTTETEND